MRLFVALVPSDEALADVEVLVAPVRDQWRELRWVRPDQWHLTLTFLGETDERRLPDLSERLGRAAARTGPIRLTFGAGGAFGSRRRARVVWLRVDGDRDPLRKLAGATGAAARRSGIGVDERPYRPHLTLARARQPADVAALLEQWAAHVGPEWTARELHLVRSRLGAHADRGSVYETIRSWPLGRPPA